jgi:hypothetical protein
LINLFYSVLWDRVNNGERRAAAVFLRKFGFVNLKGVAKIMGQ